MQGNKPSILGREPVAVQAVIQAALALAVGFGLDLSSQQIGLLLAFSAAVLALVTRQAVTPVEAPNLPGQEPQNDPDALNV